jgi:hypothetical protein
MAGLRNHRGMTVTIALSVLVALACLAYLASGMLKPSVGHAVCAEFASMPQDDLNLEQWLRAQPGVAKHTVRVTRGGQTLEVFYIFNGTRWHAQPNLQEQCGTLGYRGQVAPFRECGQ